MNFFSSSKQSSSRGVLNLRGMSFDHNFDLQNQVERIVDQFLTPFLTTKNTNQPNPRIIVGRGLNSKKLIAGKNPLRYYTENYLNKIGLSFVSGLDLDGGEGVIVVQAL